MSIVGLPSIPMPDDEWVEKARCAQVDPELFHPRKGEDPRPAKLVCAQCPVAQQCLDWAVQNNEIFGIWGGLTERERRRLKRGMQVKQPKHYCDNNHALALTGLVKGQCAECVRGRGDLWREKENRHGSRSRYKQGCHCDLCKAENARYQKQRRRFKDQTA